MPVIPILAIEVLMLVGLPLLLMGIIRRFAGRRGAVVVGLLAIATILYLVLDSYLLCNTPIIIPPKPGSKGDGKMMFPCETPVPGAELFIYLAGPISIVMLIMATAYQYLRSKQTR